MAHETGMLKTLFFIIICVCHERTFFFQQLVLKLKKKLKNEGMILLEIGSLFKQCDIKKSLHFSGIA